MLHNISIRAIAEWHWNQFWVCWRATDITIQLTISNAIVRWKNKLVQIYIIQDSWPTFSGVGECH